MSEWVTEAANGYGQTIEIREKIYAGTDWSDMVPKAVYEYITENGLTEKVIQLLKK